MQLKTCIVLLVVVYLMSGYSASSTLLPAILVLQTTSDPSGKTDEAPAELPLLTRVLGNRVVAGALVLVSIWIVIQCLGGARREPRRRLVWYAAGALAFFVFMQAAGALVFTTFMPHFYADMGYRT